MQNWNACIFEPNSWLRWMECHPGFTGYLQTIGTIVAVTAAIIIPILIRNADREDRKKEAARRNRNLLLMLIPSAQEMEGQLVRCFTVLDRGNDVLSWGHALWDQIFLEARLQIPPLLEHAITNATEQESEPFEKLRIALGLAKAYNGYLDIFQRREPTLENWTFAQDHLRRHLHGIYRSVEFVADIIRKPKAADTTFKRDQAG